MKAQNQDYPLLLAPEQSNEPRHPLGRPLSGNCMERIVITPVVATALLESFSRKNRNISENHVNKVAGSIRLGHWVHSSSVIHLSGDGTLQDGYHLSQEHRGFPVDRAQAGPRLEVGLR